VPRGTIDATEDHVDLVLLDQFRRFGFRHAIRGRAVFHDQVDVPPQQAALRIDVIDHHLRDICTGDAQE
jgi:hypothetical protein